MALRTYCSDTLNANWAEERSKPLRGVLSDFGNREYETTHQTAFLAPESYGPAREDFGSKARWQQRQADPALHPGLLSMTQPCTVQEAMRARPNQDRGFNHRLRPAQAKGCEEAETTTGAAFGVPKRTCRTSFRALHEPDAPPCGCVDKAFENGDSEGNSTIVARPIGERFMEGEEPANSTAAQRSWVYSHDPVIKYHDEGVPIAPATEGLSLSVGQGRRGVKANNRRCRNVTLEREPNTRRGTSIWIDYHIGPGEA